ncbi:hypothetical protein AAF712_010766 [Marasmius tenuissimus]|uniref:RlpA-like protein double-psi beta-barrel domain-containing protein n=1 Tax=Marasmius tenuissimus TaxID=585030 RepID=A0ABR2ZL05_9AGAR|nr:hypothetical protein PM082_014372 [Marasmius tenuissimus]
MFSKLLLVVTIALSAAVNGAPTNDTLVVRDGWTTDVTWYHPGLGACGRQNGDNDLVAAVSQTVYNNWPGATANPNLNPICGRRARVVANGKTVDVTIVDKCMACATFDIDLSPAAFQKLAPLSVGRIKGGSYTTP